ncbi:MAG: hypothetical protein IVW54_16620 [Candidatus Binataceae bacterium]|nr:hypothetical protein [Candidatus Binataceae bacterium]
MRTFTSFDSAVEWLRSHATGETCFRSPTPESSRAGRVPFFRSFIYLPHGQDFTLEAIEL